MPFLRGIHAQAKNEWMRQIRVRIPYYITNPFPLAMTIRRELEGFANGIRGIGKITIDNTLAYILDEQAKVNRNF